MKKTIILSAVALAACSINSAAKDVATDSLVNNYMRSSLYTIILNSDAQNNYYEEETKNGEGASELMAIAKSVAKTDEKKNANDSTSGSIFSLPAKLFPSIEIPNQFNDHNLEWRVLQFDSLQTFVTDADLEKYAPKKKSKGSGFAKFAKGAAGMNTTGNEINEQFDKYSPAVLNKFFNEKHVPELLIAKWYAYNPDGEQKWSDAVVLERGKYNFTDAELERAANDLSLRAKIDQTAFDMIGNTYVLAVNLRFRSYQAIVAEAAKVADAVGSQFGTIGMLTSKAATAGASAASGDGYTVQAVSDLYRLKWNNDANQKFAVEIFEKNGSLQDLIDSGICELEYIGSEKASSNIRQSLFSDQPISSLVQRATARAIDEAIIKLQNNHEEFRTVLPIIGGDGTVLYAAIGTKEGLNEKDEYEILEVNEDQNGKRTYKSVGTVKAVKDKIWNNAYGASDEVAANAKATDAEKEAVNRSYSEFKGKKGDFTGYFLRLKKKK